MTRWLIYEKNFAGKWCVAIHHGDPPTQTKEGRRASANGMGALITTPVKLRADDLALLERLYPCPSS